jgi:hypothetical protein
MSGNNDIKEYINNINIRFNNTYNDETFNELLIDIDLDLQSKKLFIRRISEILIKNRKKCKLYNIILNTLRYILQIFSAVLTFTLSINSLTTIPYLNYINLAILFILTLTTNIYFQSKLGEKYITIKKSYNKVVKEMWAYMSLSGSYSGKTHQENLHTFFNIIDKVIEQENNSVININKEIDQGVRNSGGSGSNNMPKMRLGSKNDNTDSTNNTNNTNNTDTADKNNSNNIGNSNNSIPLNVDVHLDMTNNLGNSNKLIPLNSDENIDMNDNLGNSDKLIPLNNDVCIDMTNNDDNISASGPCDVPLSAPNILV